MERLSIIPKGGDVFIGGNVTGNCGFGPGLGLPSVDDGAVGSPRRWW